MPPELQPLLSCHAATASGIAGLPSVAQIVLLRQSSGRHLLLANTHLYFANPAVHVRLMQTAALLHAASQWAVELEPDAESGDRITADGNKAAVRRACRRMPLLLMGDLNSDSTDGALALLTQGRVAASHRDWLHGQFFWFASLQLEDYARRAATEALTRLGVALPAGVDLAKPVTAVTSVTVDLATPRYHGYVRYSRLGDSPLPRLRPLHTV